MFSAGVTYMPREYCSELARDFRRYLIKRRSVDDKAELHITSNNAVVGSIYVLDTDLFNARTQIMLGTEVQHLLVAFSPPMLEPVSTFPPMIREAK